MKTYQNYTLSVGKIDEERLKILNRLYNPYTQTFRERYLPDLKGKAILDLGCGTGILSCYWAKQVGEKGKVIAVDISSEQLDIARENAKQAGLSNITFIELDVHNLDNLREKFDLVYCRFLLIHMPDQYFVLKKMVDHVLPGGYLFCEEAISYEALFADPDSASFQQWKKIILKQPEIYNTDFFVGKQLNSMFDRIGLQDMKTELIQPIVRHEEDKGIMYLGFTEQFKKKLIEKGFFSLAETDQTIDDLKAEILDKPWIGGFVQAMQIIGKKPII